MHYGKLIHPSSGPDGLRQCLLAQLFLSERLLDGLLQVLGREHYLGRRRPRVHWLLVDLLRPLEDAHELMNGVVVRHKADHLSRLALYLHAT